MTWKKGDQSGVWEFASRKERPECVDQSRTPDAVVIVATHTNSRLVVTKEFRYPLGADYFGFPAGLINAGESPEQAAIRELKEETGLDAIKINKVSPMIYSSAGLTDESVVMVFLTCKGDLCNSGCEHGEYIEALLLGLEELRELYEQSGRFSDARISAKTWPLLHGMFSHEAIEV